MFTSNFKHTKNVILTTQDVYYKIFDISIFIEHSITIQYSISVSIYCHIDMYCRSLGFIVSIFIVFIHVKDEYNGCKYHLLKS